MRNSRRTYKNGKYGVANWENPLSRFNKLYEPFDPMKGQRKKHKKTSEIPFRSFCGEGGIRTPGASQLNSFQDCRNRPLYHLSRLIPSIEGMQR